MLPPLVHPFEQPLWACMLSQLLGVSHMKLGAEPELRSLIRGQSTVLPQLLGFARTMLLQRVGFVKMSLNDTNGL